MEGGRTGASGGSARSTWAGGARSLVGGAGEGDVGQLGPVRAEQHGRVREAAHPGYNLHVVGLEAEGRGELYRGRLRAVRAHFDHAGGPVGDRRAVDERVAAVREARL